MIHTAVLFCYSGSTLLFVFQYSIDVEAKLNTSVRPLKFLMSACNQTVRQYKQLRTRSGSWFPSNATMFE
jgi:hypothetical protein